MDPLEHVAVKILGYSVKTRWQISLNYLLPSIIELLVYITVIVVDSALVYQHIVDESYLWAWITLAVVIVPAVLTFVCIMVSDQRPAEEGLGAERKKFFLRQLFNLILFPIGAIYRLSRKIFWCIESLFHQRNSYERHHALSKAAETSPFELYHFLQAFFHSGPQIILQLFILLREDMFRNYDTAFVQSLSVVFALIKMSMSAESFQRFESQKAVGKYYPWLAPHQIQIKSTTFRRTLSAPGEISTLNNCVGDNNEEVRKTLHVNVNNFNEREEEGLEGVEKFTKKIDFVSNITDDDKLSSIRQENGEGRVPDEVDGATKRNPNNNKATSLSPPNDDLFESIDEIKEYLRQSADEMEQIDSPVIDDGTFHRVPSMPPPPRPQSSIHPYFNRLSTFKDMLIFNAESFIKEKVPRIPEGMFEHHTKEETTAAASPTTADETDDTLLLPTRRKMIDGIESDDVVAKFIAFLGWNFFLIMRMISLSIFSVFHPAATAWICFGHYCLMLLMLINETRFKVRWQRTAFYSVLAYIFIFSLIEFKIRFKNVRRWYVGYFLLVMTQNVVMTVIWYSFADFLDTWWFEFLFLVIVQSGIMSLMCFLLYFFYLKPKDKVFFVNE